MPETDSSTTVPAPLEECPSIVIFLCKIFFATLFPSGFFLALPIGVWGAHQSENLPSPYLDALAPMFPKSLPEFVLYVICSSSLIAFLSGGIIHEWCKYSGSKFDRKGLIALLSLFLMAAGAVLLILFLRSFE
tara:strand:- start:26359 stop:26757 length:399 start_codon:yes stop_codon:yes gene_type:complete